MTEDTKDAVIALQTRAAKDAKRFGDALTWIERHEPGGIAIVARALSADRQGPDGLRALEQRVVRAFHDGDAAIRSVEARIGGPDAGLYVNGQKVA